MKKMMMILVLSSLAFANAFACDSVFDHLDGINCEMQYVLCSEYNQDIKVCREVKDKVKCVKKDLKEVNKKLNKLRSELKKTSETLVRVKLMADYCEALNAKCKIYEDFIGTDEISRFSNSKKHLDDLDQILQTLQK